MTNFASIPEIEKFLALILDPDQTIEVRILNTRFGTISGYYQNCPEKLAKDVSEWSGKVPGIYVTLNPVNPALLARSANHLTKYAKQTTSDTDIVKRKWLPIDFDPIRPAGISSTDEEHEAALSRAKEAATWLEEELKFPKGIYADSGNGAHLLYRIDLPNSPQSTAMVKKCLDALDLKFSDNKVSVDITCFNAARIWKLYGTMACKGDNTKERSNRISILSIVPKEIQTIH